MSNSVQHTSSLARQSYNAARGDVGGKDSGLNGAMRLDVAKAQGLLMRDLLVRSGGYLHQPINVPGGE